EIMVDYPFGQSLNKDKQIQLDSQNGVGGVSPSIRIPLTKENALRIANGEDVELKEALRILKKG
ncbi:MAG TPA: peptidase S41, partial [Clostridia bacterium]|nr:peptidase S41 [Clostridia bacterium]